MKKYLILVFSLFLISSFFPSCKKEKKTDDSQTGTTVTDIDGKVYQTVKIGNQIWMAENLKTTRYRNGDSITYVADKTTWFNLTSGAYCSYENTPSLVDTYGYLYNWYAVNDSRNIAPEGWRVATKEDWDELRTFLGGDGVGIKLKEVGTTHWQAPNDGATNETHFTALPGGMRGGSGQGFYDLGKTGRWWTSTMVSTSSASYRELFYNNKGLSYASPSSMKNGYSIRCIKN